MNVFVNKVCFILVFTFLCVSSLWAGYKLLIILLPFIMAYFISKPLNTLAKWLHKKTKIPQGILVFLVVLLFMSSFFGLISFGVYKGIQSSGTLTDAISTQIKSASASINEFAITSKDIKIQLPWNEEPIFLNDVIANGYTLLFKTIQNFSTAIIDTVFSIIKTVPSIGLFIFFMFLSLYFITKDRDKISNWVTQKINSIESKNFHKIKKHTFQSIKSYIKAIFILVFITFIVCLIGLTLLGVSYSPLIAFLIAFVDFLPLVGPAAVFIPWIVFLALVSEYQMAFALFILYLCTTLTRQIIEPKIIGHKIGASPLLTIVSMYTCYRIIGVFGLILGPIFLMFALVIKEGYQISVRKSEQ